MKILTLNRFSSSFYFYSLTMGAITSLLQNCTFVAVTQSIQLLECACVGSVLKVFVTVKKINNFLVVV